PTVVVYRLSWLSWLVGRLLVRAPFISLVNLIARRRVVPELLQRECTGDRIARSAETLLTSRAERESQLEGMRAVRQALAPAGARTARSRAPSPAQRRARARLPGRIRGRAARRLWPRARDGCRLLARSRRASFAARRLPRRRSGARQPVRPGRRHDALGPRPAPAQPRRKPLCARRARRRDPGP